MQNKHMTKENLSKIYEKRYNKNYFNPKKSKILKKKEKEKILNTYKDLLEKPHLEKDKNKIGKYLNLCLNLKTKIDKICNYGNNKLKDCFPKDFNAQEYIKSICDIIADIDIFLLELKDVPVDKYDAIIKKFEKTEFFLRTPIAEYYEDVFVIEEQVGTLNDNPFETSLLDKSYSRKFYIHVGLTNTGKTYSGMQALKKAKTGIYLGPLRLLALEKQEELNKDGCICSMITGEEEDIIPFSTHMACTVEMLNTEKEYDVAVIDECQMIGDPNRGQFWTTSILGVKAKEIYLCTAPEGLSIIKEILDTAELEYEVIQHERKTPLIVEDKVFKIPEDIQAGDAIIVFSRKDVLALSSELKIKGFHVSSIYGKLPYSSRKVQMEKFTSGENNIVVSTDAIGMGLNMPIKRIVFAKMTKFDGREERVLTTSEIKQIAGRAGRFGVFDEGYVTSTTGIGLSMIAEALGTEEESITDAYIGLPKNIVDLDANLFKSILKWKSIEPIKPFKKIDIDRIINMKIILSDYLSKLNNYELSSLLTIPFNDTNDVVVSMFSTYVKEYLDYRDDPMGYYELTFPIQVNNKQLDYYETYYSLLDLYYSFSKHFNFCIDKKHLALQKERTSEKINDLLIKTIQVKKCQICGKTLKWDSIHNVCNECYLGDTFFYMKNKNHPHF